MQRSQSARALPLVIVCCADEDVGTLRPFIDRVADHGAQVKVVPGLEFDIGLITSALEQHGSDAIYVICKSLELDHYQAERLQAVIREYGVPDSDVLTIPLDSRAPFAMAYAVTTELERRGATPMPATPKPAPAPKLPPPKPTPQLRPKASAPPTKPVPATKRPAPARVPPPPQAQVVTGPALAVEPDEPDPVEPAEAPAKSSDTLTDGSLPARITRRFTMLPMTQRLRKIVARPYAAWTAGGAAALLTIAVVLSSFASSAAEPPLRAQTGLSPLADLAVELPAAPAAAAAPEDAGRITVVVSKDDAGGEVEQPAAVPEEEPEPEPVPVPEPEPEPESEPVPEPEPETGPSDADLVAKALRRRRVRAFDHLVVDPKVRSRRMRYARAAKYCASKNTGGITSWRLPTVGELTTLKRRRVVKRWTYWSSTEGDAHGVKRLVLDGRRKRIRSVWPKWRGGRVVCVFTPPIDETEP